MQTLRKGASDLEKCEFLQEAQLMSHFKHEHILQLLGVCLDNDPQFIIMELMQGGDLLTYLRSSRNPMVCFFAHLNLLEHHYITFLCNFLDKHSHAIAERINQNVRGRRKRV